MLFLAQKLFIFRQKQSFGQRNLFTNLLLPKVILSGLIILLGFLISPQDLLANKLIEFKSEEKVILDSPFTLFPSLNNNITPSSQPFIRGESANDTVVEIYIDGEKNGIALVKNGDLYTGYFSYRPPDNLRSGRHSLQMRAMDKNDAALVSEFTEPVYFTIIPFPAPTLYTPLVRELNPVPEIIISGVAKNDSLVKVYVDNNLDGKFKIKNHPSGNTSFIYVYRPVWELAAGEHIIYTTATSPEGKESLKSQMITFELAKVMVPVGSLAEKVNQEPQKESSVSKIQASDKKDFIEKKSEKKEIVATYREEINTSSLDIDDLEDILDKTQNIDLESEELVLENGQEEVINDNLLVNRRRNLMIGLALLGLIIIVGFIYWLLEINKRIFKEKVDKILDQKNRTAEIKNEVTKKEFSTQSEPPERQPTLWE